MVNQWKISDTKLSFHSTPTTSVASGVGNLKNIDDCTYFRASVRFHQRSLQVISLSHPFLSPFPHQMSRVTCSSSDPGWWIPLATFATDLLRSIITSYKKMREIAWLKWELKLRQYTKCCKECKILFMEWCLLHPDIHFKQQNPIQWDDIR